MTYLVTYKGSKETHREQIDENIKIPPINKVVQIGTKPQPPAAQPKPMGPAENVEASARNVLGDRLIETEFRAENGTVTIKFRQDYSISVREQIAKDVVKTSKKICGDEGAVQKITFEVYGSTKEIGRAHV